MKRLPFLATLAALSGFQLACAANLGADGIFDWDGDGFGTSDCDDADATTFPGGTERCDGAGGDEDCDGRVDDDDDGPTGTSTWHRDEDGDGYGDPDNTEESCAASEGFVADGTDCDDEDEGISPGLVEVCDDDDVDEDCDGAADDLDDSVTGRDTWYPDDDGDGFGVEPGELWCTPPAGMDDDAEDCDDERSGVNPREQEECNGRDDDCDGGIDDDDPEGARSGTSNWYEDLDGDGYGGEFVGAACEGEAGQVDQGADCDDANSGVNPGEDEICEDGIDQDCDNSAAACVLGDELAHSNSDAIVRRDGGFMGYGMSGPVDSDGDGVDEVWVGAPLDEAGTGGKGAVYRLTGALSGELDALDAGLVSIRAAADDGEFGQQVRAGPDFDGDGLGDLAVSAPNSDAATSGGGAVYLYAAPQAGGLDEDDAFVFIAGDETNDFVGARIAVGDFDGDGRGDVFTTQPNDANAVGFLGNFSAGDSLRSNQADVTASGAVYGTVTLGDLDADGMDELVIGDYGYSRLYVYAGGDLGSLSSGDRLATVDLSVSDASLGWAVSVGVDFDGDGYGDVFGGAPEANDTDGLIYRFAGPVVGTYTEAEADLTIEGEDGAYLGFALAFAPDADDDGSIELLAGAPHAEAGAPGGGAVYVFEGNPKTGTRDLASASAIWYGDDAEAQFGAAVAGADVDGDGMGDLLGAGYAIATGGEAGVAVVYGATR